MADHLDIFGQQPFYTINIQLCLCFNVSHHSLHSSITQTLSNGLERLYAAFPWLAADVVCEGSSQGNTGIYKFKASETAPRLVVRDLRHEPSVPSIQALRLADFPMSMLDESVVAPRNIFPDPTSENAPVFLVQANFISDGLLLTFVAQHNTMDMTGLGHVVHLFQKACRNEQFSSQELSVGNMPRHAIVPLLDESYNYGPELDRYLVRHAPWSDPNPPQPSVAQCSWAYFRFTASSLAAIKSFAMEVLTPPSFVSTDDTLTAFLWQSISRARLPHLEPSAQTTVMRAIDVRQHLGIPANYPGPIQSNLYTTFALAEIVEEHLGTIALQLRSALDSDVGHQTSAIATFLSREPDKSRFSFGATMDLSKDVIISSWAKVDCYDIDFNLGLGVPETARKPRCNAVEALSFIMPKTPEGNIAIAVCLRDEDMDRLRSDEAFTKFGVYVG